MVEQQDNVFFYLTLLNENYAQPGLRPGSEQEIVKGMYLLLEGAKKAPRVNLLGSGTILRESIAARELLDKDWGIAANVWSCPSFNQLARDGQDAERWNLLHPADRQRVPFVAQQLEKYGGPVVASTDYIKNYAEQIRPFLPKGPAVQGARHRRLRPERLPHQAARVLRSRPALHRRRRAEGARRRGQRAADQGRRGDRPLQASTRTRSIRSTPEQLPQGQQEWPQSK